MLGAMGNEFHITDVYPETEQAADGLDFDVRESGICLHWYHFVRASAHAYTNCISAFVGRFRRLALAIIQGREAMLSRSLHNVAFFSVIMLTNALVESLASSPVVPSTVSSSPYPSQ